MRIIQDLSDRVRAEYLEMPGLHLTSEQVQRLCGIESAMCALILDSLVTSKFLSVTSNGHYARLTEGGSPRATPAKAVLKVDPRSEKAS